MPTYGRRESSVGLPSRSIQDLRERRIEWARLYGMKSPLTFAERKARRIQRRGG